MGTSTVVFIFGGILLGIGILGGGFELKELKVPKVSMIPRLLSALVGLTFIGVGIGFMRDDANPAPSHGDSSGQAQVEFTIHDHLGDDQVSEQVTVIIDGKTVGNLTVNMQYPSSSLLVTVPRKGRHSYMVDAKAVFKSGGQLVEYSGVGEGIINVESQKNYELQGSVSGNTWLVVMVEQAQ